MTEERPSLEAVLDHYGVPLRGGRQRQMVPCPLHDDRTPSCSINLDNDLWRCHSCGEGGDAWSLLMKKEGTDFAGARAVAATLGLPTGGAGGGDQHVSGSRHGGRRTLPPKPGARQGGSKYVPRWRRG